MAEDARRGRVPGTDPARLPSDCGAQSRAGGVAMQLTGHKTRAVFERLVGLLNYYDRAA